MLKNIKHEAEIAVLAYKKEQEADTKKKLEQVSHIFNTVSLMKCLFSLKKHSIDNQLARARESVLNRWRRSTIRTKIVSLTCSLRIASL